MRFPGSPHPRRTCPAGPSGRRRRPGSPALRAAPRRPRTCPARLAVPGLRQKELQGHPALQRPPGAGLEAGGLARAPPARRSRTAAPWPRVAGVPRRSTAFHGVLWCSTAFLGAPRRFRRESRAVSPRRVPPTPLGQTAGWGGPACQPRSDICRGCGTGARPLHTRGLCQLNSTDVYWFRLGEGGRRYRKIPSASFTRQRTVP